MRIILAAVLALSLSACATFKNPLSPNNLVSVQSAYGVTLSAAVAYRKLCNDKVIARQQCAPIVARLQDADRKVQVALRNLRTFVRDNPTVDAAHLLLAVKSAVDEFSMLAATQGVQ